VKVVSTGMAKDYNALLDLLGIYLEQGYEGQMLRVSDSLYEGKRSKNLIKHKEFEDDEFEIVSIEEGKGNWAGAAKRVEIRLKDGTTQFSGVRGSFDMLKDLLYNANDYIGTDVTVRYQNKTEDGKLRFPVIVAFWKGKRDI
jgi:DNA ligase-1